MQSGAYQRAEEEVLRGSSLGWGGVELCLGFVRRIGGGAVGGFTCWSVLRAHPRSAV